MTYPLHLDLRGKTVVVVGAGRVAERRLPALLEAGAIVTVIAPEAEESIRALAAAGTVELRERPFEHGDLDGAWLVQIATGSAEVNADAASAAATRRIFAVRADLPAGSTAITPAVVRSAGTVVSVATGDPLRSTALRDAIGGALEDGSLAARPRRPRTTGSVVLIGGGPGDPDLITVRGRHELLHADVVLYDRLGPTALLDSLDPDVERIDVGKSPGDHTMTQDRINSLLIERASAGLRVARLKGGDAFVLGRGFEELLACTRAGLRVDVVPGVSSATAAPAAAGIPVTQRGVSAGFVVVSGHVDDDLAAAASTGLTVVILMGVAALPRLAAAFATRPSSTPVAVIHRAFGPEQRTVVGTLADVDARVRSAGLGNPAVIVVGDVVSFSAAAAQVARDRAS